MNIDLSDREIEVLSFLNETPNIRWKSKTIKRYITKPLWGRGNSTDTKNWNPMLRKLRRNNLIDALKKGNGGQPRQWKITERGIKVLGEINES